MNENRTQLHALTSLRFFAAAFVVLFHHGQAQFAGGPSWLQHVISGGYVGVPFFFILSGFILAYNYVPRMRAGQFNARGFWVARFARIYPVYVFSLLVSAPLFAGALVHSEKSAAGSFALHAGANFGLLQAWIPGWAFSWNGPAWSLSVEASFYILFPLLITQFDSRRRWQMLAALASVGTLLLVTGKFVPSANLIGFLQQQVGWANPLLWLPLFIFGMCLGERYLSQPCQPTAAGPRIVLTVAVALLIVALMAANLQRLSQLLYCYTLTPLCAALIYLLADKENYVTRLLSMRPLVLVGEASYSLYILHRPIHDWFAWAHRHWSTPAVDTTAGFVLYLTACLAASLLSLKLIEYPCREWIRRRFQKRKSGQRSVPALPEGCPAALTQ